METESINQGLRVPLAKGVCPECLTGKFPKNHDPRTIMIYREHNQAAAIMYSRNGYLTGQWLIITPISAGEWIDRLTNGMIPRVSEYPS